jgi:hypothetical protein
MHSSCILRILTKKDLLMFKKRLKSLPEFAWYPYFLALVLIELRLQDLPRRTKDLRDALYGLEQTTGIHKKHHHHKAKGRGPQDKWDEPAFEAAPARLTSIASDCAYYEHACRTRRRLVMWLDSLHKKNKKTPLMRHEDLMSRMFNQKRHFMETSTTETENRMAYLGKRAEIQLQMVSIWILGSVFALHAHTIVLTHNSTVQ